MRSRAVRGIVDVMKAARSGIALEIDPAKLEKRTHDVGLGVQPCQSARTCIAKDAHENRFDLVIECVRGEHRGLEIPRHRAKKTPPLVAPFTLFSARLLGCSDNAAESGLQRLSLDHPGRAGRVVSGSVIEGGHEDRRFRRGK
jgi:hypothetical protein